MATITRKDKDEFIIALLEAHGGDVSGGTIYEGLIKKFGRDSVSARLRQEMHNLIQSGQVTREGTGSSAMFGLRKKLKANKRQPKSRAVPAPAKPVAFSTPESAPKVEIREVEKKPELNDAQKPIAIDVLEYLMRNGERPTGVVVKKPLKGVVDLFNMRTLATMHDMGLVEEIGGVMIVTRKGRKWRDAARVGRTSH